MRGVIVFGAVLALAAAVAAQTVIGSGEFGLSSANSWAQYPQLSQTVEVKEKRTYLVRYQISQGAAGTHLCTQLYLNGAPVENTRYITGNTNYASNQGLHAVELTPGTHTFAVFYRTPGAPYVRTQDDWQGTMLSVVPLPRGTEFWLVSPRSGANLNTGNNDVNGLRSSFTLDKKRTVMAWSVITSQCFNTYLLTNMVVDGTERPESRSIAGYTVYCSPHALWIGNLEKGSHEIKVRARAGFNANIGVGSDWETYALLVIALPDVYPTSVVPQAYSWNSNNVNSYSQFDDNKDAVWVPKQGGVVLFYQSYSTYNPYNSHLVSFMTVNGNGAGLKSIYGDCYHGTPSAMFLREVSGGRQAMQIGYRSPVYNYNWPYANSDWSGMSSFSLVIPNDEKQAKTCSAKCDARASCVDGQCVCWAGLEGNGATCTGAQVISCMDAKQRGVANLEGTTGSGVYTVYPIDRKGPLNVYCDQETDGGGWTVFQRRFDGSVAFMRRWADYKEGFGAVDGEHWLGMDHLYRLTNLLPSNTLRVDLQDVYGNKAYAQYSNFRVGSEDAQYVLTVSGFSGNAGDSLSGHNGYKFSTFDRDNDVWGGNCALQYHGAWWYTACHASNLNGLWQLGPHSTYANGPDWYHWKGHYEGLKTTMMIR